MLTSELEKAIGLLLDSDRFRDYCPNGLQVEGRREVRRIAGAVSASLDVLTAAQRAGADTVLVHHGYFWKGEDARITGIKKARLEWLLRHDMNLLAYHLPLDAHPQLGNNAQLAVPLGARIDGWFGEQNIAAYGALSRPATLARWADLVAIALARPPLVIGDPQKEINRIAWCSGGAQGYFEDAIRLGVDAYLTGEISEQHYHLARESGVADYILDPSEVDVAAEVMKITGGKGVDVAFECSSVNKVLDTLVAVTKATGVVVIVSIWSHPATINVHSVVMKELDVRGTIAYCNDHQETIKLVEEGKINLEPFITQRIQLEDLVSKGFETLIHNNESAVKIIVQPRLK